MQGVRTLIRGVVLLQFIVQSLCRVGGSGFKVLPCTHEDKALCCGETLCGLIPSTSSSTCRVVLCKPVVGYIYFWHYIKFSYYLPPCGLCGKKGYCSVRVSCEANTKKPTDGIMSKVRRGIKDEEINESTQAFTIALNDEETVKKLWEVFEGSKADLADEDAKTVKKQEQAKANIQEPIRKLITRIGRSPDNITRKTREPEKILKKFFTRVGRMDHAENDLKVNRKSTSYFTGRETILECMKPERAYSIEDRRWIDPEIQSMLDCLKCIRLLEPPAEVMDQMYRRNQAVEAIFLCLDLSKEIVRHVDVAEKKMYVRIG